MPFFFYQAQGKESPWILERSEKRPDVIQQVKPAFSTVLDLSHVPDDNDWSKVTYSGPLYFDFDADGDLALACSQVKVFVGRLVNEYNFDAEQARYFASGSKGFHVEVPGECLLPKFNSYVWLPYIYREIATKLMVDTLDLNVYTGKRGRQWRTEGVQRENGCYKVPLTLEEILSIEPESYLELIQSPRQVEKPAPPQVNAGLSLLFTQARDKVLAHMRGRKKRQETANAVLDPWRKAGRVMPSVDRLMRGEVRSGLGFQHIAMQLAIYASSVGMGQEEFLQRCEGLINNHISDGYRYNTAEKRGAELVRMLEYMSENTLYDFEPGPLLALQRPGADTSDLGMAPDEDAEKDDQAKPPKSPDGDSEADSAPDADGDQPPGPDIGIDVMAGVRGGVYQSTQGLMAKRAGVHTALSRLRFTNISRVHDADTGDLRGYELTVVMPSGRRRQMLVSPDCFTTTAALRKFCANLGESYHGTDNETNGIIDMLNAKSSGREVWSYPREGFMVIPNPRDPSAPKVMVYLTQSTFLSSEPPGSLLLKYKPVQALSSYKIDIDQAPELNDGHIPFIHDLFNINRPDVVADLVGWFVAAFYRACYIETMKQFPLLQIYGDAGSGKSQTVRLLAHMHWFNSDHISMKSAASCTNFALDTHVSTSTSAPLILDEYKPREMRARKGVYEKVKETLKMSYINGDIGERGLLNKGAENSLSVIKSRATAPIVFIGEAIEAETALLERSVTVALSQQYKTPSRTEAFMRLQGNPEALSAIGRDLLQRGLAIDLAAMRDQVSQIRDSISASLPINDEGQTGVPDRLIFNRAVVVHGLRTLRDLLHDRFGDEFDKKIDELVNAKANGGSASSEVAIHSISEISKVLNRISLLSRVQDKPFSVLPGKDYMKGDAHLDLKVERVYDAYRAWCASIHDRPLFDTMEAFIAALNVYGPVTDKLCAGSDLRDDDSNERVYRFDLAKLRTAGVGNFRG